MKAVEDDEHTDLLRRVFRGEELLPRLLRSRRSIGPLPQPSQAEAGTIGPHSTVCPPNLICKPRVLLLVRGDHPVVLHRIRRLPLLVVLRAWGERQDASFSSLGRVALEDSAIILFIQRHLHHFLRPAAEGKQSNNAPGLHWPRSVLWWLVLQTPTMRMGDLMRGKGKNRNHGIPISLQKPSSLCIDGIICRRCYLKLI